MSTLTTAGIIATFNQQAYISEAVLSLAGQADEVIVVDDCSTDDTFAVVTALALALDNVRVQRNDVQCGVSESFNRAAAAATADVLLIQGGDDRSLPHRAATQAAALEDGTVVLVHSVPRVIDGRGALLPAELAAEFLAKPADADPLGFLFFEANFVCAPAAALRRAQYLSAGGFRRGLDLLQDYSLWLDLATTGTFLDLEEPVVEYRKHGANLSREYVGLDSPKRRRLAAESEFIRNRFVDQATPSVLSRLAADCAIDPILFGALDRPGQQAMIRLSHKDKLLNRRGVSQLFEIAGSSDADSRLAALGLTISDLERFATLADHENLEDVGRAIAVSRQLEI